MEIKIAIIGLGRVGSVFFQKILEHQGQGVRLVAVADPAETAPALQEAKKRGIPTYTDGLELAKLGEEIDILFDLSGSQNLRQKLREGMVAADNHHTIIAPEMIAYLLWALIANGSELPNVHPAKGY